MVDGTNVAGKKVSLFKLIEITVRHCNVHHIYFTVQTSAPTEAVVSLSKQAAKSKHICVTSAISEKCDINPDS